MVASHLEPWLAARSGGRRRRDGGAQGGGAGRVGGGGADRPGLRGVRAGGDHRPRLAGGDPPPVLGRRAPTTSAGRRLAAIAARLRELVGPAVFTDDPDATLEGVVGELLRARGATLATAESCTGGLVAERLTRVPGSSDYFVGGAVIYTEPPEVAAARGARGVAGRARRGLRAGGASDGERRPRRPGRRLRAGDHRRRRPGRRQRREAGGDRAPGAGGAGRRRRAGAAGDGEAVEHRRVQLPGDREGIRDRSAQIALEMLRRRLEGGGVAASSPAPSASSPAAPASPADGAPDDEGALRLFVAFELPERLREETGRRMAEARRALPPARWVRAEGLHLTLKFLGATDRGRPRRAWAPTSHRRSPAAPPD